MATVALPDTIDDLYDLHEVSYADHVGHTHRDEYGVFHRCYHKCRGALISWQFWVGLTIGFWPEHILWDKVPPFSYLTHWAGL